MSMTVIGAGHRFTPLGRTLGCCLTLLAVIGDGRARAENSVQTAIRPAATLAQADEPQVAPPPPVSPGDEATSPEKKRKARSAAVLLTVLAGIALTGLLLIIVSVSVRGLQRKFAGRTRIDQEPQDILPDVASPTDADPQQEPDREGDEGAADDETQYT